MGGLAQKLVDLLIDTHAMVATAESCTGGLIASKITDISGASSVLGYGYVTYSNAAKTRLLDVPSDIFDTYGAVSPECAQAMCAGALKNADADFALSVTGIAGPGGGTAEKPVGLVYIAVGCKNNIDVSKHIFNGNRQYVREQTVEVALSLMLGHINHGHAPQTR